MKTWKSDDTSSNVDEDISHQDLPCVEYTSTSSMKDIIAGKLLKIKEKHLMSHAAIKEIVALIEIICDDVTADIFSTIWRTGEELSMDTSSPFF
jgi:hypothetical protein